MFVFIKKIGIFNRVIAVMLCAMIGNVADASASDGGVMIRIEPTATVDGPVIYLRDVATVSHTDSAIQKRLEQLVVGPAPSFGRTVRVDFSTIRSQLRSYGVDLTRVKFSGRSVILVSRSAGRDSKIQQVSGTAGKGSAVRHANLSARLQQQRKEVESAVADAVRQHLQSTVRKLGPVSVQLQIPQERFSELLAVAKTGYQVRGGTAPWNRQQTFQIGFHDRQKKWHVVPVRAYLTKAAYVLAAKSVIPKGRLIRSADLVWKQVNAIRHGDYSEAKKLVGMEATETISKNETVSATMVRKILLVRSNDIVTVYRQRGAIRVSRQMRARGNGATGEMVVFTSLKGRDRLVARVTNLHEAELVGKESSQQREAVRDSTGTILFQQPVEKQRRKN